MLTDYKDNQGFPGPGTPINSNPGEFASPYHIPVSPQVDTVQVTTGDATVGWSVLLTNATTGDTYTFTFDPTDVAGAASATANDAARSLKDKWNSDANALLFGQASIVAGALDTVVVTYRNDRQTYSVAVTPAGAGATTDTSPSQAASRLVLPYGTFAFGPTQAQITAGVDPNALQTQVAATAPQLVGAVVKGLGRENPPSQDAQIGAYYPGENLSSMQRGSITMRTATAIQVGQAVNAVVSAGATLGQVTNSGLDVSAFCKCTQGAPAGGVCVIEFTIA